MAMCYGCWRYYQLLVKSPTEILIIKLRKLQGTTLIYQGKKKNNAEFPGGQDGKASAYNAGDPGLIPGSRRSPGERNGNPLQYS